MLALAGTSYAAVSLKDRSLLTKDRFGAIRIRHTGYRRDMDERETSQADAPASESMQSETAESGGGTKCPDCLGTGSREGEDCITCGGTGVAAEESAGGG